MFNYFAVRDMGFSKICTLLRIIDPLAPDEAVNETAKILDNMHTSIGKLAGYNTFYKFVAGAIGSRESVDDAVNSIQLSLLANGYVSFLPVTEAVHVED